MTHDRELERLLDAWLSEGSTSVSDRVIDSAADRIARQRQRPAWRLRSWRFSTMSTPVKLALLGASLVAALLAGSLLLAVGGPPPTPTSTPAPSASRVSTPTSSPGGAVSDVTNGTLRAGRYRFRPFDAAPSMTLEADVPEGWRGYPKWALIGPAGTSEPGGIGTAFLSPAGLFSDPCHWDLAGDGRFPQQGDISTGATVDDFIAALRANPHYTTGAATDTTIGGYAAKQVDLELPSDIDFATTCDRVAGQSDGVYFVWGTGEADGSDLYAQGPGSRWHLSVADINGVRVIVMYGDYAGTPEADRAAARSILESLVISP